MSCLLDSSYLYGIDVKYVPETISIVSIGAGNVASSLIPGLKEVGCHISQIFSRDIAKANKLAVKVNATAIDQLEQVIDNADLYLIMVTDRAISEVVRQLPILSSDQYVAHTSGASRTDLLRRLTDNHGCFYPLQTFGSGATTSLTETPMLIYGTNPKTLRFLKMLARQISSLVSEVSDKDRLRYHLAAVLKNNFINHLACLSDSFLLEADLDPQVLTPIMKTTFDRIINGNPCEAQTGPAMRDDQKVMDLHKQLLTDDETLTELYQLISQSIHNKHNDENPR